MAITGRAVTAGGGGIANRLDFTYTGGTFNERTADGVVEFLETGILTMKKDTYVDVFMVGGGAGGVTVGLSNSGGAGGSGGCTRTIVNALLRKGVEYQVVIGAGGTGGGNSGGETSAFGYTVSGGTVAAGGSGGGKGGVAATGQVNAGDGGSNGSDGGSVGSPVTGSPGKGQGATTREFGEATGKLYAGAGGGGAGKYGDIGTSGAGGEGGGAKGNSTTDATANTGGGGGGGKGYYDSSSPGGKGTAGGSGIVCIRLHQDDPTENVLSGTWKFNDTLTMPSALFTENFDYDGTLAYAGSSLYGVMGVQELSSNKDLCFGHNPGDLSANYVQVYSFTDSNLNHTGIYLYSKGKIMIHLTFDYKTDEKCTTPGQYLKYHRTFQGLSTRELAEKVGIVPATLVLYENDRHPIKYSTAVALANVLGIDRNRLLDEYTAFVDYPYFSLLKKVRQDLSLTQIQMAELIGIGQTSYSGWEREIRVPRRKEYDKILAALKKLRVNVDTYLCQSASI